MAMLVWATAEVLDASLLFASMQCCGGLMDASVFIDRFCDHFMGGVVCRGPMSHHGISHRGDEVL